MYKVAIIGCGHRSADHIRAYQYLENAQVVACCDLDQDKRLKTASDFSLHPYADISEMVHEIKPDLVHIITPPNIRYTLMKRVSDLGVPMCIIEKPIALGVADWRQLCGLEAESKTLFGVSHQVRWQKNLVKCQQAIHSGSLGEVRFIDISCGMDITNQGTHILNYGLSLNADSPVTEVFGSASGWDNADRNHPGPLSTQAYLKFANGVRGLWTTGPVSPKPGDPATTYQHVRVAAYCQNGSVSYEEFANWYISNGEKFEGGSIGGREEWQRENIVAQAGLAKAMFAWFATGKPAGTALRQSLHEWKTVLALYQSTLSREPVLLADFAPDDDLLEKLRLTLVVNHN